MTQTLERFIEQNKVCSNLIFRNWNEFLDLLFACGGSVNEILWFEYVLQEKQKDSLGGGGYRDNANPECMWAETMIYGKDFGTKSLSDIKDHIDSTIKLYYPHILVPCFFDI